MAAADDDDDDKGIFVFGLDTFPETTRDAISSLPLELSWKIFSYLDGISLGTATRTYDMWHRIILSNKKLREKLNIFELSMTLGSESLAKFYRKNRVKRKKKNAKNYLPTGVPTVHSTKTAVYKSKRGGEELIICAKRYKCF